MCKRSDRSHMCYHYKYGHWIGLRAVIVLDYPYVYNLSTKHMVDFEICESGCFSLLPIVECDKEYGRRLDRICRDSNLLKTYRVCVFGCFDCIEPVSVEELAGDENHLHAQQVQLHIRGSMLPLQQEPTHFGEGGGEVQEG